MLSFPPQRQQCHNGTRSKSGHTDENVGAGALPQQDGTVDAFNVHNAEGLHLMQKRRCTAKESEACYAQAEFLAACPLAALAGDSAVNFRSSEFRLPGHCI